MRIVTNIAPNHIEHGCYIIHWKGAKKPTIALIGYDDINENPTLSFDSRVGRLTEYLSSIEALEVVYLKEEIDKEFR